MPKPVIRPKFTVLRIIRYPACLEIDGTTWDKPQSCIDHLLPPGLEMLMCQECRNIPDAYGPLPLTTRKDRIIFDIQHTSRDHFASADRWQRAIRMGDVCLQTIDIEVEYPNNAGSYIWLNVRPAVMPVYYGSGDDDYCDHIFISTINWRYPGDVARYSFY